MTISEFLKFAKECKTKAELSSLAKANGVKLSKENLEKLFKKITSNEELNDDILDNVLGGTTYGITSKQIENLIN